ncbi:replication factor C subunit [Dictyostelium purpureum]|uniref:Replication factor C subunit n=1 Tax=Dictyostelium purpureum TaxID=5786 RepID=F1A587_DICPU|nr:replication factor C subunit [Dictyostelium purpureum]EGC28646.1 replication factor C subunit [Dictyostelium purpureum]|eukprot:XP_003294831.1 replication factor C subunit [Dictyostelium purpureum]
MTTASKKERSEPWVSKYRPKTMDDVSYQDDVVSALKKSLSTGNLPHLLFYGPPGTGKTSTILAIAMDIYGPELIKQRVLELNASDERGIEIVRTKIKNFAGFTVNKTVSNGNNAGATFKLIILDEADSMTSDAQAALRRTIETTSKTTRFCLLCNYISRIIDPLASRCAKFRFKPLDSEATIERLKYISIQEGIKCTDSVYQAIQTVSDGDMRKAITYLQSAFRFYGNKLTEDTIYNISGTLSPLIITSLIKSCKSNSFKDLQSTVQSIISQGYPVSQVVSQLFDFVLSDSKFNDKQKSLISMKIGNVDRNLIDGSEEFLQLLDLSSYIMKLLNNSNDNDEMIS